MLSVARSVAPPAVVGDDEKQIRALLAELADILAESRLIANCRANLVASKGHHLCLGVAFQSASRNAHGDAVVFQEAHPFGNGFNTHHKL